jgi:SagB-type dehydrogenase family enzyme
MHLNKSRSDVQPQNQVEIKLPKPVLVSKTSIEEALSKRRSIRAYSNQSLTLQQIGQLLWAAQGITSNHGFRTTPSAGALYPLEIYLVAGDINNVSPGIYRYEPIQHKLQKLKDGDVRIQLAKAAIGQDAVKLGTADIVITALFSRTTKKYGERGIRYALMEAGHAAQNIYLQTVSLNLATVSIGSFDDIQIKTILNISNEEEPLYILPIGIPSN